MWMNFIIQVSYTYSYVIHVRMYPCACNNVSHSGVKDYHFLYLRFWQQVPVVYFATTNSIQFQQLFLARLESRLLIYDFRTINRQWITDFLFVDTKVFIYNLRNYGASVGLLLAVSTVLKIPVVVCRVTTKRCSLLGKVPVSRKNKMFPYTGRF